MTTQDIYTLANELTTNEVSNIILSWQSRYVESFNTLVRLGDSEELACATVMENRLKDGFNNGLYTLVYEK